MTNKIDTFVEEPLKLSYICACNCKESNLPPNEEAFLRDQRTKRKMMAAGLYPKETRRLRKKLNRELSKSFESTSSILAGESIIKNFVHQHPKKIQQTRNHPIWISTFLIKRILGTKINLDLMRGKCV